MNGKRHIRKAIALFLGIGLAAGGVSVHAEGKIRVAQQFGISYLIFDVVKEQKLIEKHGAAAGIDINVEWAKLSGVTAMNEALLSGNLDIVSAGVPPTLVLWDRTKGKQDVKAVAALGSLPNYLVTNNPDVRSIKDLSDKDRIATPAAGVGFQSRTLQIETAKLYGKENFARFDKITISLPHPDATAALISGGLDINAHFASAPFYYQSLAGNKDVHKILSSYDVLGGPHTFNLVYTTRKFHDENPKTYKALFAALGEAAEWIRNNKAQAAQVYIRQQQSKLSPELVTKIVEDPENDFTITPQQVKRFGDELHDLDVIKNEAASWKDYFFEEAHVLKGS
ncbi:MAG: ABC transporter substrate-binding protein [Candidatus Accumulibacter sp.]|jgi:NitT/TauT family transport system substrate-binding protein|nr:ABC transporter substrate-binding protein [Accumulibacter sp.]